MSRSRGRLSAARDAVRTQLWPLPTAAVVAAVALGIGLPRLDARLDAHLPPSATEYLFGGDADAARSILETVAGSLITVTALTFSLTVVTLQLASSQFSPRLLRTFTRDLFVQATLALFLATFTYTLTVLRSVRSDGAHQQLFVPRLSVTLSFLLALASVVGLVLFLAHLTRQIRVETMLRVVHTDTSGTVERMLEDRTPASTRGAEIERPANAVSILCADSGFLVELDSPALLAAAVSADAVIVLDRYPGSSLVAGTPIGCAWSRTDSQLSNQTSQALQHQVVAAVSVSFERTATQDVAFGLRQITDVANKALSPGINDPTTAIHALSHSAALLCELAGKALGPRLLHDDNDVLRVVISGPSLAELVELAIAQPRRYGAADPDVLARIFTLLRELAWCLAPDQRHDVADQLDRLRATAQAQDFDATEHARLTHLGELVEHALVQKWHTI